MKKLFTILGVAAFAFAGAQNLLTNPGFESGLAPWAAGTVGSYTAPAVITNDSHSGAQSVGYASPSATTGFYQNVPVTGGKTYTITFWYKTEGTSANLGRLWSVYKNAAGSAVYTTADANTDEFRTNNKYFTMNDGAWNFYTATMPSDPTATSLDVAVRAYGAATKAYFDDFTAAEATTAAVTDVKSFDKAVKMNTVVGNELNLILPERATVNIYSTEGKLVSSNRVDNGASINTSKLVKGTYIVTVDNGSAKVSRKVIKN